MVDFKNTEIAFKHLNTKELRFKTLLFSLMNNPKFVDWGMKILDRILTYGLPISKVIEKTMYKQFCGGKDIEECLQTARKLRKNNIITCLHYGAEGEENEKEYQESFQRSLETINKGSILQKEDQLPFFILLLK